jgi:Family of unknown function (DUF6880)
MASKTTLNEKNLVALGAEHLAALLIEISTGNAGLKRRLRLELTAAADPARVGREVRKRLVTIGSARSFVEWNKMRALIDDLEAQRRLIVERVAAVDATEALELTWQFLGLAESVYERCDDSNGSVGDIFRTAVEDLGRLARQAKPDAIALADRILAALLDNGYGQYDYLIGELKEPLGAEGLAHLKERLEVLAAKPVERPSEGQRRIVGWGFDQEGERGAIYEDEVAERARTSAIRLALKDVADAQGDVDAFIRQYDEATLKAPWVAAEIAVRLMGAGRANEALEMLEAASHRDAAWPDFQWEDARIAALQSLDRIADAQAARLACFERSLSTEHLRDYLKHLPDFEDVESERQALDHAECYPKLMQALHFLIKWPAHERAAQMVIRRADELNGDHYTILTPAADALAGKHPLAATLIFRAMINFALEKARSKRYRHAARHLLDCAGLAVAIEDFGDIAPHDAYVGKLKQTHGRKHSFWRAVDQA